MKKTINWIKEEFDYKFEDESLLQLALTHRSVSSYNNERLEFLGDAILGFIVTEFLFNKKNDSNEGDLTRLRSHLVQEPTLHKIAQNINLSDHLIVSAGEKKSGTKHRSSVLSDALEAFLGAMYVDGGIDHTRRVILDLYAEFLPNLPKVSELKDAKTKLQEILQSKNHPLPVYSLIKITGQDHQQKFFVKCQIDEGNLNVEGEGVSRRIAEQDAALKMLRKYDKTNS
ncbi:MAG: ribonuclease III [Pseudomonadota bacterium]|nr:ribonuclease III [Pseudomonadota bacterium]